MIRLIMHQVEREPVAIFTAKDIARWPRGLHGVLIRRRILRESQLADSILCDDCEEGCIITPEVREDPRNGVAVGVHYCAKPGCGRITIDIEQLRQWQSDFEGLADWLCAELSLGPAPVSIVGKRLYSLGTQPTPHGAVEVFLARGLSQASGYDLVMQNADRLRAAQGALVIVPAHMPLPALQPILASRWVTLSDFVRWDENLVSLDASPLVKQIESTYPAMKEARWITVSDGAQLLLSDLPYLDVKRAAARVSKAAGAGKFVTNGKTRDARRIERISFDAWRLAQRDRALDAEDDEG
ncbi:MAG: hypothetical protein IT435_03450 [Phycisphaerales bacterium]|nr:hypothetical protein [Phycisphaerales bacterium]